MRGRARGPRAAAVRDVRGRRTGLGARDAGAVRADAHRRAPLDRAVVVRRGRSRRDQRRRSIPASRSAPGSHPTTRLCLEWLAASCAPADSVLDYGCGSGILAIAAAKLGATRVVGVDIDPQAVAASRANALANGVDATFVLPDGLAPSRMPFDVVVANILANPLRLLAPALAARVRRGRRHRAVGRFSPRRRTTSPPRTRGGLIIGVRAKGEDGWVALVGARTRLTPESRLIAVAVPPRCPKKNTPAVPAARPCSASRRSSSRFARARCAAGIARRCSTASRNRFRSPRDPSRPRRTTTDTTPQCSGRRP